MKKKTAQIVVCVLLLLAVFPISARADTGPKPSVQVDFTDMTDEVYYVTLLSKEYSTGPATAYNGNPASAHYQANSEDYAIWEKVCKLFRQRRILFLQQFENVRGTTTTAGTIIPRRRLKFYFTSRSPIRLL